MARGRWPDYRGTGNPEHVSGVLPLVGSPPESAAAPDAAAAPSPRHTALAASGAKIKPTRHARDRARAKDVLQLALIGQEINTPPRPEESIAYIARFLVHATLPYTDPGPVDYWERTTADLEIVFEPGLAPKDRHGRRRRVGIPYGVYPRLIFSALTTQAVRRKSPELELGNSFTDWIRTDLRLNATGGPNGTITRLREQMTRMLAMKITITARKTGTQLFTNLSLVPIEGLAAFWDPLQPEHHDLKQPRLLLNHTFFQEALRSSVPFDERVQRELAKRHACMAIDLYHYLTLKQFHLYKAQAKTPELVPWSTLEALLGHSNKYAADFRRSFANALELVLALYPGAKAEARDGGLLIRPSAPHIAPRPKSAAVLALASGSPPPLAGAAASSSTKP